MALREDTSELEGLLPLSAYPDVNRPGGRYPGPEQPGRDRHGRPRRAPRLPRDGGRRPRRPPHARRDLLVLRLRQRAGTRRRRVVEPAEPLVGHEPLRLAGRDPPESPTGPQPTERASSAKQCDSVGGAVAWSGNEVTTCEFAVATAQALVDAAPDLPATVTARSPVTKKDYAMECSNTTPVVCRGGTDALVYVDLPQQ